jgi:predicted nucleic acid-binding protein
MILVDTSVWIEFFRGRDRNVVSRLRAEHDLDAVGLPAPVRIELLSGARAKGVPRLQRALSALPTFYPTRDTWNQIERWAMRSAALGHRFGVSDLLIAALAAERGAQLWSLDGDFRQMAKLRFVKLFG